MSENLVAVHAVRSSKWTHLNLSCLENKNLSWKAKAIHTYMISRPPGWQIKVTDLITRSTDGQVSMYSGINELITLQYVYRMVRRNDKRQIIQHGFVALEEPIQKLPDLTNGWEYKRDTEKLQIENLDVAFDPPIINNRSTNKQEENNEHSFSKEKEVEFSQGENSDDVEGLLAKQRSKLDTTEYLAKSKKQPSRTRTVKSLDMINAEFIIDSIWKEQGLAQHKPGTKTYKTLASVIESMLKGKCAWFKGRKFHRQDFAKSIKQFSLAALNPDYEVPITSTYKDKLKKMPFLTFIYNDFSVNGDKSLFLKYLENDAKLLAEKGLKDTCSELTDALIDQYYQNQPNLNKETANRATFIRAANKLQAYYESILPKINGTSLPTTQRLASWLITAVFKNSKGIMVPPYWLTSKPTFEEKLPLYLVDQGIIPGKRKKEETVTYKKWVD